VIEKCHLSWRRATADEYEQCTIIGAFRQILNTENNEKYLMSIVKVNTLDRTLFINNEDSINQFTTRLNLHGKFIHIDSKFEKKFIRLENIFLFLGFLELENFLVIVHMN
jgi:hypothetical protein